MASLASKRVQVDRSGSRAFTSFRLFQVVALFVGAVVAAEAQTTAPASPLDQQLRIYLSARAEQLGRLAEGYGRALATQFDRAADSGDLTLASAFKTEREQLEALLRALRDPGIDLSAAARRPANLPDLPPEAPAALTNLRQTWTAESKKIDTGLTDALVRALQSLEAELTRARNLESAERVLALRRVIEDNRETSSASSEAPNSTSATPLMGTGGTTDRPKEATRQTPFENSLKMRFVPVEIVGGPTSRKLILFSVWETRVSDYAEYARRNRNADKSWEGLRVSGYGQEDDHPVVAVNWFDAKAFCDWLTETERRRGFIGPTDRYRLPSDHEWSCAAGIGDKEDPNSSPLTKRGLLAHHYWWGTEWPPPNGFGNFSGEDATFRTPISGFRDGFPFTAPVGSFPQDEIGGLFDLAGNAAEWCEDLLDPAEPDKRSLRGGSWARNTRDRFWVSTRFHDYSAHDRAPDFGFRCVLEIEADF